MKVKTYFARLGSTIISIMKLLPPTRIVRYKKYIAEKTHCQVLHSLGLWTKERIPFIFVWQRPCVDARWNQKDLFSGNWFGNGMKTIQLKKDDMLVLISWMYIVHTYICIQSILTYMINNTWFPAFPSS